METTSATPINKKFQTTITIILVLILLVQTGILVLNSYNTYKCQQAAAAILDSDLASQYDHDVFNNSRIDNINKQILMSSQYEFLAQQQLSAIIVSCQ